MPTIEEHEGICVIRDDLHPGGTKARFIPKLFDDANEVVYASPCEGGAQFSISFCAAALGKKATIFLASRKNRNPRFDQIKNLGAKIMEVMPGYLSVVQAKARAYALENGATLLPFGLDVPEAATEIAIAARELGITADQVWCASGSGVLARGLAIGFPDAEINVVQVGRKLDLPPNFKIWEYPKPFSSAARQPPFPSDPHYDAKAWEVCRANRQGITVFWNVLGPVN